MPAFLITKKTLCAVLAVGMLLMLPFTTGIAQAQQGKGNATAALEIPITGTFTDALGGVGQFTGTFDLQRFVVRDGQIVAIGTLTGSLTDSLGAVLGSIVRNVLIPLTDAQGTCHILHLELGPLDLDLLGLQVHLDQIVLDIDAQAGSGNLLGNLLCAVAGLLDQGGPLQGIANLLNRILAAL